MVRFQDRMYQCPAKGTSWHVRPSKSQIRAVGSESSMGAPWVDKGPTFLQMQNENSDQTKRMVRMVRVFAQMGKVGAP